MHAENQSRDDLFGPVLFSRRSAQAIGKQIRTIFRDCRRGICIWLGFVVLLVLTLFPPWVVLSRDGKLYPSMFPDGENVKDLMSRHFRMDQLPLWVFQDALVVRVDYKKLLTEIGVGECFVLALYLTWGKAPKGEAKGTFVGLRFDPEYLKRIDAAAKISKQSRSEWIRSTLTAAIGG